MILSLTPVRFKLHAARVFGRKEGVVCGDLRFTYQEFNERCDRLSDSLLALGLAKGQVVAFLSFNCHRLLEAYYGVPQLASILLPLNIRLSAEELVYILNDAEPRFLFFDPEFIPLVDSLRPDAKSVEHFIALRPDANGTKPAWAHPHFYDDLLTGAEARSIDYRGIDENSVAELFYTSGTTAHPKGVMLTHRNLYLHAFYTGLGLRETDASVGLYTVPLFHVNSWGTPHILTLAGGRHVMIRKFDPTTVLELIERERVTRLQMVPAMVIAMINHPDFAKYDLKSVKELIMGGAPTSTSLIRQVEEKIPGCTAMGGYGLTETSPVITRAEIKAHLLDDPRDIQLRRKATAGYAFAGSEVRVVDPHGNDVTPDGMEVGEVVVRGDVVMAGYWKQPEATAGATRDDWFHTSDLATIDEEGYVLIVDRAKDMILTGGENVASAEIERVLYGHPAVMECAVIAVPDDQWGEVAKAIVTLKPGMLPADIELIEHCRKHLAGFKVPKSIEFVQSLPKGGTGKILKKVLREKYWAGRDRRVS
ncbi:MAG TPA: long-chain-fatty-acid--CoA ligase [Terriglobia bacterium]|nr:long-chain-fatty-acid--CoA ligase [Terriglobia bacterium]